MTKLIAQAQRPLKDDLHDNELDLVVGGIGYIYYPPMGSIPQPLPGQLSSPGGARPLPGPGPIGH